MDEQQRDLLVQSRFRNAILWDLLAGRSVSEISELCGVDQSSFGRLLNLRQSPVVKNGTYGQAAQKIAEYFRMLPEDLFPPSLYALTLPKVVERAYSSEAVMLSLESREVKQLTAGSLDEHIAHNELRSRLESVLQTLTPREEAVLKKRFGFEDGHVATLEDVGKEFAVSRNRIRQIEGTALRKLRHPMRSRRLRSFVGDIRE